MKDIKVIKNQSEYELALNELDSLMEAAPDSKDEQALELLAVLVEKYEAEHFPISLPKPVEAIKFRMEQESLSQKDLIPYIGSQSKVSEVLNYKRPLSLEMIRKLHEALEIPADVLIQKAGEKIPMVRYRRESYPFTLMFNRGYFPFFTGSLSMAKQQAEECLQEFFSEFKGKQQSFVLCKNSEGEVDRNALLAWQAQVLRKANQSKVSRFSFERLTMKQIKEIVHLSVFTTGPLKARGYLANLGIPLVILEHLPHTYLDGACFLSPNGHPVIGLTLRHDRQDNFWFTLLHELAHIYLHLSQGCDYVFADNTEHVDPLCDEKEQEANRFSTEQLIPNQTWFKYREDLLHGCDGRTIIHIAEELNICPAIIAGRIRHELGDYSLFSNLLGVGEVRHLFMEAGC